MVSTNRQVVYEEGNPNAGLEIYFQAGQLHAGLWSEATNANWLASDNLSTGAWHHVALVLRDAAVRPTGGKLDLWVDGNRIAVGYGTPLPAHPAEIDLGRGMDLSADKGDGEGRYYFAGRIGNLDVYNRALSAKEIARAARP